MNSKNILIVAGEPSGDLYASNLVKDLRSLDPGLKFSGVGGPLSRSAGVETVFDISKLALVGVVEVLKNIPTVKSAYDAVMSKINAEKIDLAILVDYPGFNLRLAKELKKRRIPIAYYISPQVWAWGEKRIDTIKRCVEKVIVFFKFEEALYKKHGVNAEFVGHPLLDIARTTLSKEEFYKKYGLAKDRHVIALLPGSRIIEINRLLPILISSCKLIKEKMIGAQFIIARHPDLPIGSYEGAIKDAGLNIRISTGDTYNILGYSDFALIASGTATLEGAIMGTPSVIIYKTNFLTAIIYHIVKKTRFLGLVNIIAGREIVPEVLQSKATPENIAKKAIELLGDKERLASMRNDLSSVKSSLGVPGAGSRAARAILLMLQ